MTTLAYLFLFYVPVLTLAVSNTGNGSGSDEGPADYVGLRDGPSDVMFDLEGAELIEGPNIRTGDGINDGAGMG